MVGVRFLLRPNGGGQRDALFVAIATNGAAPAPDSRRAPSKTVSLSVFRAHDATRHRPWISPSLCQCAFRRRARTFENDAFDEQQELARCRPRAFAPSTLRSLAASHQHRPFAMRMSRVRSKLAGPSLRARQRSGGGTVGIVALTFSGWAFRWRGPKQTVPGRGIPWLLQDWTWKGREDGAEACCLSAGDSSRWTVTVDGRDGHGDGGDGFAENGP
uniref:Uncharacterized protein n=1 Tax=Mycena chlorophos TaxID=658473 RepID=A0ABQ0LLE6_MYCCL|nr:predicted protein [Mycena chlorophos]